VTNAQFLETENIIHSLADELLKLKSAVQQYEETRKNLDDIHESLEKIGVASQSLADNTKTFMAKMEQIDIETRLEKLREDGSMLIQGQARHAELLNNLGGKIEEETEKTLQQLREQTSMLREEQTRQTERTIQRLGEESSATREGQARQTELMTGQYAQQSKTLNMTRVLVVASLLAQIATILILLLR
jgi:uncharacterized phage infection (PIP) family protein YhgE